VAVWLAVPVPEGVLVMVDVLVPVWLTVPVPEGVLVTVDVLVAVWLTVPVPVPKGVLVTVDVLVAVWLTVLVLVTVDVLVPVWLTVPVPVAECVAVPLGVLVAVSIWLSVLDWLSVAVWLPVPKGVAASVSVDVLVGSLVRSPGRKSVPGDAFVLVSGSAAASTETPIPVSPSRPIVASGLGLVASPVSASVAASTTVSEGVAVSPSTPASPAESVSPSPLKQPSDLGCESGRHAGQTNINRARSHLFKQTSPHVYMQPRDIGTARPRNKARPVKPSAVCEPTRLRLARSRRG
jgi:hypothetical protein